MKLASPIAAWFLCLCAPLARAHEGPPYPVLVDKTLGPYTLSLYADPDIGTGTFFVNFDPPARKSDADPHLWIETWPSSGRLPPQRADAHYQPDQTYVAQVEFDQGELWQVRLHVEGSAGSSETQFEVEATPPGYGRWDLLIYAGPFLLLGVLWFVVSVRRRKLEQEAAG